MTGLTDIGGLNVSRETLEKLKTYQDLLVKWSPKINLVAPKTLETAWNRHFVDSAQVFEFRSADKGHWVDLGSGAGFPGLVCAVLAAEHGFDLRFTLVESDARKCAFLRTVIRELNLSAKVKTQRIEALDPQNADILSARALSSLTNLLEMVDRHRKPTGQALLLKGATWQKEVAEAQNAWKFQMTPHTSRTDDAAVILEIGEISSV